MEPSLKDIEQMRKKLAYFGRPKQVRSKSEAKETGLKVGDQYWLLWTHEGQRILEVEKEGGSKPPSIRKV